MPSPLLNHVPLVWSAWAVLGLALAQVGKGTGRLSRAVHRLAGWGTPGRALAMVMLAFLGVLLARVVQPLAPWAMPGMMLLAVPLLVLPGMLHKAQNPSPCTGSRPPRVEKSDAPAARPL